MNENKYKTFSKLAASQEKNILVTFLCDPCNLENICILDVYKTKETV